MSIPQNDIDAFEAAALKHFSFLETDFNLRSSGTNTVEDDPRDSCVIVKFRQHEFRVDIVWNPFAMSLGVLIRVESSELGRRERYVYLEPFIEFISNGETVPFIPQIYPGMSVSKIEKAMDQRQELFAGGVESSLGELAGRLRDYLGGIRGCSVETIRKYQAWYQSRGKAA
jgi:hypothetical protein